MQKKFLTPLSLIIKKRDHHQRAALSGGSPIWMTGIMIAKIFFREGQDGPLMHAHPGGDLVPGILYAATPFEAEAAYFWMVKTIRTTGAGMIKISPVVPVVNPSIFRTDREWRGPREGDLDRFKEVWAMPEQGWQGPPSRPLIQGVLAAANVSQAHAAEMLGVIPTSVRRWIGGTRAMPWTAWYALLVRTGIHPDYGSIAARG
ncbi:MAG: hypothetical protein HQM00_05505 [Magnetococcales bacterium]|nr:hypothetical protein [Magnetococcales bacterium]